VIDVLIVGAGLSGLAAAECCRAQGLRVRVVEACESVGGRIKSAMHNGKYVGDLGPSWVWPEWQPASTRWLADLQIDTFAQYDDGHGLLDFPGQLQRHPIPGQHGIARIVDGPQSLVQQLVERLTEGELQVAARAHSIVRQPDGVAVHLSTDSGAEVVAARQVIVAVPMRIALEHIQFEPALPADVTEAMAATPTWMAAQAKVVAMYEDAFWRTHGLSGRVASRVGPMVEMHDHCGENGEPASLFGFMGISVVQRDEHRERLQSLVIDQLQRCFGDRAALPRALYIEDWSLAETICASADRTGVAEHPQVRPDCLRQPLMDGALHFAGAEVAVESPGLIDGALNAAEHAAKQAAVVQPR
jgi:monoamine oxidase